MSGKKIREKSENFEVDDKWQPYIVLLFFYEITILFYATMPILTTDTWGQ